MTHALYTPYNPAAWLDQVINDFEKTVSGEGSGRRNFAPAVDVLEEQDHYLLRVEVPGVPKENIKVEVKENRLTVSGQKENKWENREGNYRYLETGYGAFSRSFALPRNVRGEAVTAEYQDGVLALRIPKAEESLSRAIEIK